MPFVLKSKTIHWTFHARDKMRFYGLSEQRVGRVINTPKRIEEGIAPKTVAVMQPTSLKKSSKGSEDWNQEIWVMFQDKKSVRTIISAWRYPGKTKPKSDAVIEGIKAAYNEYMRSHESR